MAWATITEFKANQVNLAGDDSATANAQITLSLNATGSAITACLHNGGYSVSTIKAAIVAGAVYDFLVLLNIRLAALDLMAGGGVSAYSGASEKTYISWRNSTEAILQSVCNGSASLDNSGTGDDVDPPASDVTGLVSDSREMGVDLIDPLLWEDGDPVDADYTATEVANDGC